MKNNHTSNSFLKLLSAIVPAVGDKKCPRHLYDEFFCTINFFPQSARVMPAHRTNCHHWNNSLVLPLRKLFSEPLRDRTNYKNDVAVK